MARQKPPFEGILPADRRVTTPSGLATELTPPPTPYGISVGTDSGGWEKVAAMVLRERDEPIQWVPDACVKINPRANIFWDAAREAHSRNGQPQVLLAEPIAEELAEWLSDPRDRTDLAAAMRMSIQHGNGFLRATDRADIPSEWSYVYNSYLYLTSVRRYLAIPNDDGRMLPGADPNDLSLTFSKVIEQFGPVAKSFAKAGQSDFAASGQMNINDESLVLLSFFWAIQNETPVCLLTTDRHVFNTFFKLQCMIDLHYRSHLAASLAANGYYGKPTEFAAEESNAHFSGVCHLYPHKSVHFDEMLVRRKKYFDVELILVQHDGTLNCLRYTVEPEVKVLFSVRSQTLGRNTDLFGKRNFYIDTGGFCGEMLGHMCIAQDIVFEKTPANFPVSRLDLSFAINQTEQFLGEFSIGS